MCLNPRKIYNPAAKLGMNMFQRYEIEIPCGECAECLEAKKNEWYLRTYWQCKQTWDEGGYILFDTLTYNNENLPHISDFIDFEWTDYKFTYEEGSKHAIVDKIHHNLKEENKLEYDILNASCFKTEDYRYFFVRLRRALEYRGYDSKKVKYFLSSEYGSTEGKTHRPHYHILFFVTDRSLSPLTLSSMIDRCWKKGRTDGVTYYHKGWSDSKEYVLKKRVFGRGYNEDENHMRSVCNYVAKYVMKDSEFQSVINDRLDRLFKYLYAVEYDNSRKVQEKKKKLLHEVSQFHRQSKGFGEYAIQFIGDEEYKTGMMWIPDKKSIKKHIPIPMYYLLKLIYYPYVDRSGKKKYILNDKGIEWKRERLEKNIERMEVRMREWFVNIDLNYKFNKDFPYSIDGFKLYIRNLLDGRSWKEYAEYILVYKGRIRSDEARLNGCKDDIDLIKGDMFLPVVDEDFDADIYFTNYATKLSRRIWKCNFVTYRSIGEFVDCKEGKKWTGSPEYLNCGYQEDHDFSYPSIEERVNCGCNGFMTPMTFKQFYCYDENSDVSFRDFDKIFYWYCRFNEGLNRVKQGAWNLRQEQTKRFKDLGLLDYNKNI